MRQRTVTDDATVLPGTGWWATYETDVDATFHEPVLAFVMRPGVRSITVHGYVADETKPGQWKRADSWSNFVGFARST